MRSKPKIDWDTVELILPTDRAQAFEKERKRVLEREQRLYPERRGRSVVKQILSGAAQKARARGAIYTHTQLRKLLPAGLPTLAYGWWLVAAAMEGDVSRGVETAAQAIIETSYRVLQR